MGDAPDDARHADGGVLPEGWQKLNSRSSGNAYWFNAATGESTFDEPEPEPEPDDQDEEEEGHEMEAAQPVHRQRSTEETFGTTVGGQEFQVGRSETMRAPEQMATLLGVSTAAGDTRTVKAAGVLTAGTSISLPQHAAVVQVQFGGKKRFQPVLLQLKHGTLIFRDEKTGEEVRTGSVVGCEVGLPKKARKGHEYVFRLNLVSKDSKNHSKYVVSVPDEDELKCWIAAVRPYSVMTDADVAAVESAAAELSDMVTDADGERQDEDELENSGQSPSAQELHQAHSHDQTLLDVVDAEQMMHVQPADLHRLRAELNAALQLASELAQARTALAQSTDSQINSLHARIHEMSEAYAHVDQQRASLAKELEALRGNALAEARAQQAGMIQQARMMQTAHTAQLATVVSESEAREHALQLEMEELRSALATAEAAVGAQEAKAAAAASPVVMREFEPIDENQSGAPGKMRSEMGVVVVSNAEVAPAVESRSEVCASLKVVEVDQAATIEAVAANWAATMHESHQAAVKATTAAMTQQARMMQTAHTAQLATVVSESEAREHALQLEMEELRSALATAEAAVGAQEAKAAALATTASVDCFGAVAGFESSLDERPEDSGSPSPASGARNEVKVGAAEITQLAPDRDRLQCEQIAQSSAEVIAAELEECKEKLAATAQELEAALESKRKMQEWMDQTARQRQIAEAKVEELLMAESQHFALSTALAQLEVVQQLEQQDEDQVQNETGTDQLGKESAEVRLLRSQLIVAIRSTSEIKQATIRKLRDEGRLLDEAGSPDRNRFPRRSMNRTDIAESTQTLEAQEVKSLRAQLDIAVRSADQIRKVALRKQAVEMEKERQLRVDAEMQIKKLLDLQANARARSAAAVGVLRSEVMEVRAAGESRLPGPADGSEALVAALHAERDRRQKAEEHFDELLHAQLCIATHEQVAQVWTSGRLSLSASSSSMVHTPPRSAPKTVSPVFTPESPSQAAYTTRPTTPPRRLPAGTAAVHAEGVATTLRGVPPVPKEILIARGTRQQSQQAAGGRASSERGTPTYGRGFACGSPTKSSQGKLVQRSGGHRSRTPVRR